MKVLSFGNTFSAGEIFNWRKNIIVKGISRQVILVDTPEPKLFEQAIFILRDDMGEGITDETLLKEAQRAIQGGSKGAGKRHIWLYGAFWASAGALATGLVWLMTVLI